MLKTVITFTAIGVSVKEILKFENEDSFLNIEPGQTTIRNKIVVMK